MSQKIINRTITANNTKKPSGASLQIDNPLDADMFVNLIEILPSDNFSLKGKVVIEINGLPIDLDDSAFSGFVKFPISLAVLIRRGSSVDFYVWNGSDSTSISCDVNVYFDTEQKVIESQAELMSSRPLIGNALSGATNTIYTCPTGKKARIFGSVLLDNYGAASTVSILANGVPIESWLITNGAGSGDYDVRSSDTYYGPVTNQTFSNYKKRQIDVQLDEGQSLTKTQNIGDNATLYYTLKVQESRK